MTTDTRAIPLHDGRSVDLVIERPDADSAVGRLSIAGRAVEIVATRDEGLDGEPPTWRAEASDAAHVLDPKETNVGYASAEDAIEATARLLAEGA